MSDAPQPITQFAKAHQQSLDTIKRAWAAADEVTYGPMPSYAENSIGWRSRMRTLMATSKIVQRVGLGLNNENLRIILDEIFAQLEQMDCIGNEDMAWPELRKQVRVHLKRRRLVKWARVEQQERRDEITAYGKLLDIPQAEISRTMLRVRTVSSQWIAECKRELDVWKRQHAEPLPDTSKVYADGFVSDTTTATATMKEHEAAEAKRKAKQPSVLDVAFPRDANGEPIGLESDKVDDPATQALNAKLETLVGADDAPDELTIVIWSAVDAPIEKQQMLAFKHYERELHNIDLKADVTAHILKTLGEPLGSHIEAHGIALTCGKLQEDLNSFTLSVDAIISNGKATPRDDSKINEAKPATTTNQLMQPPVQAEEKRNSGPVVKQGNVDMPQRLLKVYPADFGSIIHKGIKFSVTLCSDDATWEDAVALMDRFAVHADAITAECKVQSQPANVTALPQTSTAPALPPPAGAPPAPGTPDSAGRVPGMIGNTVITGVKKVVNEGRTIIELWAGGQYAEHTLRQPNEHAFVGALTNLEALAVGTN